MHFGGFRLEAWRLGLHRDGVANGADLERDVDARRAVDRDGDLGLLERLESLLAGFEAVDAGREVADIEMAGLIREGLAFLIRVLVGDHDGGAGHRRARAVFHVPDDRSVEDLRQALAGDSHHQNKSGQYERRYPRAWACRHETSPVVRPIQDEGPPPAIGRRQSTRADGD